MKKFGVSAILCCLVLGLLLISIVASEETTSPPGTSGVPGEGDLEKINNITDQLPVTDGQIDPNKLKPFKSKAEERIDAINKWLEENAYWFKWVFKMVPEISWLFFLDVMIMLVFLVWFVLNGDTTFSFIKSKGLAQLFGLGIYVALWLPGVDDKGMYIGLASIHEPLFTTWWGNIILVVLVFIYFFGINMFTKYMKKRRERQTKEQEELDREILHKEVDAIGK